MILLYKFQQHSLSEKIKVKLSLYKALQLQEAEAHRISRPVVFNLWYAKIC
jgi:hypothetical protein